MLSFEKSEIIFHSSRKYVHFLPEVLTELSKITSKILTVVEGFCTMANLEIIKVDIIKKR